MILEDFECSWLRERACSPASYYTHITYQRVGESEEGAMVTRCPNDYVILGAVCVPGNKEREKPVQTGC